MEFLCRTRADSPAQGKPKVFFTCQDGDFDRYFERITSELFTYRNCAVFCREPGSRIEDPEEYRHWLEQVQLLVIPVTTLFLTKPSQAMEDFHLAMELHKPVLMLMQEHGLESLFGKKCGDIQFLDRTQTDPTAIPYEQKLKKFLGSVLVGDETAEKVRGEFAARIFLSYRKKDRLYANRLMRGIHGNPACREIAIWYDEYLIPGEHFNSAIEKAIRRSDLFALAVTENLVNEKNYVQTIEYPKAQQLHKSILPVKVAPMQPESVKALSERYSGIPDCVDGENKAVSEAICAFFPKEQLIQRDDPEHRYQIGLAYLNGIDVEVHTDWGAEMIRSAAEAGSLNAMQKLAQMYENGEGVKQNGKEAVFWYQRLSDTVRQAYRVQPDGAIRKLLIHALTELAVSLHSKGRQREAISVLYEGIGLLRQQMQETPSEDTEAALASCYQALASYCLEDHRTSEAGKWMEAGLELSRAAADSRQTEQSKRNLSQSLQNMGYYHQLTQQPEKAAKEYEAAAAVLKHIPETSQSLEVRDRLAEICVNLAALYRELNQPTRARMSNETAIRLLEVMVKETDSALSREKLAAGYENMALQKKVEGRLEESWSDLLKAAELLETVWEETGNANTEWALTRAYQNLGEYAAELNRLPQAGEFFAKAYRFRKEHADGSASARQRLQLLELCSEMAELSLLERREKEAAKYLREAQALGKQLWKDRDTCEIRNSRMRIYEIMMELSYREGQYRTAKKYGVRALQLSEQLEKEASGGEAAVRRRMRGRMYEICMALGDRKTAEKYLGDGRAMPGKTVSGSTPKGFCNVLNDHK